jgi:predicted RNA-binding Zn ribbon-like protein
MVRITPETIKLRGGSLSLDFANTADWTQDGVEVRVADALVEDDSLDRWGRRLEILGRTGGRDELLRARILRAALHRVFSSLAASEEPDAGSLSTLHAVYAEAVAAGRLAARADGCLGLDWRDDEPRRVRYAVAADAVALLADPTRVSRLRRCPGRDCGWIFIDRSGRRRWCSMSTCGSREKMRSLYARRQASQRA